LHQGRLKLVEPLETLKEQTRIVTATMEDGHVECPDPDGVVLGSTVSGRQRRWVVSHLQPDWQTRFETHPGVRKFESTVPSLEEIFVAVCEADSDKNDWQVARSIKGKAL
jgi:ABC-2 type transport system ATP-binding protein